MDYRYYALWMPTVFHQDPLRTNIKEKKDINISDTKNSNLVSIFIDNSENITIKSTTLKCDFFLRKITHSSNGLFVYEHIVQTDETNLFPGNEFPYSLYNAIKDFYHIHEYHNDEEDTHLKGYFCEKKQPNIKELYATPRQLSEK